MDQDCKATTEQREDGWFYVVCSKHGDVFSYNRVMVNHHGVDELQKLINAAWEKHEPIFDPIREAPKFWLN